VFPKTFFSNEHDRVTIRSEKFPKFLQSSPNSLRTKKGQNIYSKAQFESPNQKRQTTFETLNYVQQTML
jgi:hypothetical protein